MVLDTGFEPVRNLIRGILSPLCLANFTNPAYHLSFQAVIDCYSVLGLVCHRESVESGAGSEIRTRNATLEELSVTNYTIPAYSSMFYCTSPSRSRTCSVAESNCAANIGKTVLHGMNLKKGVKPIWC